jgi:hypothetical protein
MKLSKTQKIILVAGGALMYFMSTKKDKTITCQDKVFLDLDTGKPTCEEDLNALGYYYWNSDDDLYPSGYYHWSNFVSGFGVALDEEAFTAGLIDTNTLPATDPKAINAQKVLKMYYDGTPRLQKI